MKTLLLMRHAKSSWENSSLADHDRPLAPRGRRDASRMARHLAERDLVPDAILCSSSERTRQTAQGLFEVWGELENIEYTRELYHGDIEDYLAALSKLGGGVQIAMTLGHNPGAEYFLAALTGERERMPTAAIAHIELDLNAWPEIDEESEGRLLQVLRPKEL